MSITTPTTSRVSDEMLDAALKSWMGESIVVPFAGESRMRAALEAALASQGDVVAVSELRALVGTWQRKADSLGFPYGEDYLGCGRDLSAILNRGGK
ncbi:hypothetical protein [Luteibacter yeojuensis]|uniref:Uncharacterized protein n=1 Tax=Luteibacter yeojuensis TaxID=345309 RepID=A0A7X5TPE4_9GAMM|nr:hypothetical protein [Luteibacter yeojuensis]NID14387.1 hypothetical protein [Luteibacter yeojuensis]